MFTHEPADSATFRIDKENKSITTLPSVLSLIDELKKRQRKITETILEITQGVIGGEKKSLASLNNTDCLLEDLNILVSEMSLCQSFLYTLVGALYGKGSRNE